MGDERVIDPVMLPDGIVRTLLGMRVDSDHDAIELASRSRKPLEDLCKGIEEQHRTLLELQRDLDRGFSQDDNVKALFHGGHGISFFPQAHNFVTTILSELVTSYLGIREEYSIYLKGRKNASEEARAAKRVLSLTKQSVDVYLKTRIALPGVVKTLRKSFAAYDKYLHERFIKSDEDHKRQGMLDLARLMHRNGEEEDFPRGTYVKVKLLDGNPVLTDVLLEVIDGIPEYKEVVPSATAKKRPKARRIVSNYAVEDTAEKMAALSHPTLLRYIQHPSSFFQHLGSLFGTFYQVAEALDQYHRTIVNQPHHQIIANDPAELRKALQDNGHQLKREIEKIRVQDLDRIVQSDDEVLPDNRREMDHFRVRGKLLDALYEGMQELSQRDDFYDRSERAKEMVRSAVDLKDELKNITLSQRSRRLRQDKRGDNEFYVGRQEGPGIFVFERKPTPDVKIDDVIGESFVRAKQHLREIIETGNFSRVMRLSAPGGKVRSNILLIGPYGCGKTELARAVCGDERVIGASVSVANTLTAYMHHSVTNVKRIYDEAAELRSNARDLKPVVLALDEFDGWFARGGQGTYTDTDMAQIENILLEVLDGMEDYSGIITMAMTNNPRGIPNGIMRRFRYVDIVGQLTKNERVTLLGMYLGKSLPLHEEVPAHYERWAEKLDEAPGDVVRKVVDEVHFMLIPRFIANHPQEAARMERVLSKRETKNGILNDDDIAYVRGRLEKYGVKVTPDLADESVNALLQRPPIRMQIDAAKKVYRDARRLLEELSLSGGPFGLRSRNDFFEIER